MAVLKKVRVQLLDEETSEVLEEVDVLTSADCVSFADGETFQQKLNSGKLKGQKGDTGAQGLKGDKGDKGETGQAGAKGTDGATWLFGTTTPSSQGKTGDFYLNTTNFDVYSKATGTWVKTGNIKGATGSQGLKGDTGARGPQGPKGADGDNVKIGSDYGSGKEAKLFFKVVS